MRTLLLASCLMLATFPAQAISRYNSEGMSCAQAQAIVQSEGAAILRYRSLRNPSLPLYDRYVASSFYCQPDEYAKVIGIPTADSRQCPVYKCQPRNYTFPGE